MRELGLRLRWTEKITTIGAVVYDHGEVTVEAVAREQAYPGETHEIPDRGSNPPMSDWYSARVFTVDDDRDPDHLTLVYGEGTFTRSWAFAELLISGVSPGVVARAAARLTAKLRVEMIPRAY